MTSDFRQRLARTNDACERLASAYQVWLPVCFPCSSVCPAVLEAAWWTVVGLAGNLRRGALQGEEQKRLLHLLSPEGAAQHRDWHKQSRCLLELMQEFPSAHPPLGKACSQERFTGMTSLHEPASWS